LEKEDVAVSVTAVCLLICLLKLLLSAVEWEQWTQTWWRCRLSSNGDISKDWSSSIWKTQNTKHVVLLKWIAKLNLTAILEIYRIYGGFSHVQCSFWEKCY
jgi:hypothetical protein